MKRYICPVCGYNDLEFKPYNDFSNPATGFLEYCPSCGFQFGVHDLAKGKWTWKRWRTRWVEEGMKWGIESFALPLGWNPKEQLKNIGIDIEKSGWEDVESRFSNDGEFLGR